MLKNKIEKLEKMLDEADKLEKRKNYKYVFSNEAEYKEAKIQGLTEPEALTPCIILDE